MQPNDHLLFKNYTVENIQQSKFIVVHLINFEKDVILKIYKRYNLALEEQISEFTFGQDLTSLCNFNIKSNGKIALDINIK